MLLMAFGLSSGAKAACETAGQGGHSDNGGLFEYKKPRSAGGT